MSPQRTIKSFIRRARHLGPTKQKIFEELWPRYGIESVPSFSSDNPVALEIGFGYGEHLFHWAATNEHRIFLGVEVHRPGIANLLSLLADRPLNNLKIYQGDAVELLQRTGSGTFEEIAILFPDPWPKRRHQKRRLIQESFIKLLHEKIVHGGILRIATDWGDYAEHITALFDGSGFFRSIENETMDNYAKRAVISRFEQRGLDENRRIFNLIYINR